MKMKTSEQKLVQNSRYFRKIYSCFLQLIFCYVAPNAIVLQILRKKLGSSHQRCSIYKGVPRNFTRFTGRHLCRGLFFNKVAGLEACNFI